VSATRCAYETCIDPEEIGCNRGFLLEDCEFWKKDIQASSDGGQIGERTALEPTAEAASVAANGHRLLRLPWTGNSLGLRDLELVTACNPATVIGVIGPFNSGKTTLLTLVYLLIQRGERLASGTFAGSLSLIGWENLAANLRWQKGASGPRFPPHTARFAGRQPGMLHMAIRDTSESRRDFLFTDPPGEWFGQWAQKEDSSGAEGARWIHRYADRFLFLADREALSSAERGKARDALRDLARRVSPGLRGRPVAVVWTKSDQRVPSVIEKDLRNCFAMEFPDHAEFRVRMRFGNETRSEVEEPCLALADWAFASRLRPRGREFALPVHDESDFFLAYRGRS